MTEPPTVYLVDDDAAVRRGLARLLKSAGYDVVSCDTAETYLALKSYRKPSCLLLDIRMPGMTGLELQRALHGDGSHPPVILLSGHVDAATAERAMTEGAVAVLSKPVDFDTLVNAIELSFTRTTSQSREQP